MFELVKFTANRSIEKAREIYDQRIADALEVYDKHHQNFRVRPCFICGGDALSAVEQFHGTYGIVRCDDCASYSVNPVPDEAALTDYYNNGACNVLLDEVVKSRYRQASDYILDERTKFVLDLIRGIDTPEVNILEIGCGSGAFLAKLKHFLPRELAGRQVRLAGIDIDATAVGNSVDPDLTLTVANAESYVTSAEEQYDLIVHFELIEHLIDPFSFVQNVRRLLRRNGRMLFTTPNADGLEVVASDYNDFRLLAHSIFPPMHLNAFSVSNMTHFALRAGFQIADIATPGKLDMDMVSLTAGDAADEGLRRITALDDATKGLIQHLLILLRGSSHMRCVLRKNA